MKAYRLLTHSAEDVSAALSICNRQKLFYQVVGIVGADHFDSVVRSVSGHSFGGALALLARFNDKIETLLTPIVAVHHFTERLKK